MTNVATYQNISDNISEDQRWLAYIVLLSGEFWHVRFNGTTEEIAKTKAIALWTKENAKWERLGLNKSVEETISIPVDLAEEVVLKEPDPWASVGRGKHFAGKVWMRNGETLKRVALTEIALYEKNGYHRSSPRGK